MTLDALPIGQAAIIEALTASEAEARLLVRMGVAVGQRVEVLRRAAFGGPLHVRVGEVALALDAALARGIRVQVETRS